MNDDSLNLIGMESREVTIQEEEVVVLGDTGQSAQNLPEDETDLKN